MKKNCYKQKNKQKEAKSESKSDSKENNTATLERDTIVSSSSESCTYVVCQDTDWMIDLGDSFHTTPKRDFFASYKSDNNCVVRMSNKDTSPIVGVGDIHMEPILATN